MGKNNQLRVSSVSHANAVAVIVMAVTVKMNVPLTALMCLQA
jgi:hypothetical protein